MKQAVEMICENPLDWLISQAKENDCEQFHPDSAVHRHDAHRFYFKGGLDHHFQMSF
ncbi:MAG: hypothetical protein ACO1OT_06845 [Heyndrickxia sp.]